MESSFIYMIDISFAASWVALCVIILRWLMKKAPVSQRLFLWLFVGLRSLSGWYIPSTYFSVVPNLEVIPINIAETEVPAIDTGFKSVNSIVNPIIENNFTPEVGASVNPLQIVVKVAIVIWFIGVAAMLFYALISWLVLYKKIKESTPIKKNIFICDYITTPFVSGLIKPKIYLPSSLDVSDMECVIAHEQSHIKRGDHIWKLIGYLILCIYWFNPVMWVSYNLFSKDIELACDAKALKKTTNLYRTFYAEKLINFSSKKDNVFSCPLAFCETAIESRVKSVLTYKKPKIWFALLGAVVCFSMTFVSFSGNSTFVEKYEYSAVINDELADFVENELLEYSSLYDKEKVERFTAYKVLEIKENNENTTVYLSAQTRAYVMNNGIVERKTTGLASGIIAITVKYGASGYELVEFWQNGEGEMYWKSIYEKLPSYLWNSLMYNDDSSELEKQCELQAQQKMAGKSREECFVNNEAEAIEIAKKVCTIEYRDISVEQKDWGTNEYIVSFWGEETEYPEETIFVSENGVVG
ncbi:MAG: M56 family metallopeptidase [Ruminococcaceae bacterium]|nr:M56 family metallopeptidase [Oscillospiraceae bacterium]